MKQKFCVFCAHLHTVQNTHGKEFFCSKLGVHTTAAQSCMQFTEKGGRK